MDIVDLSVPEKNFTVEFDNQSINFVFKKQQLTLPPDIVTHHGGALFIFPIGTRSFLYSLSASRASWVGASQV